MKTSPTITKISEALVKAQQKIGAAKKDAKNPFFHTMYADLGSVMEACKSAVNDEGITILQPTTTTTVETILLHSSGEWLASETSIVCKEQSNPQALGSAITYARRYGLSSMLFIPSEDDDANAASPTQTRPYYSTSEQKVIDPSKTPGVQKGIKATEKQIQLISILLDKKGRTDEELYKKYNVTSKKDLTLTQASQIIDNLEALPDMQAQEVVDIDEVLDGMEAQKVRTA